jgi:hypothetical protein
MPRLARLDAPGVLHHLIICGVECRLIFKDDQDRENFLERLTILLPETQTIWTRWKHGAWKNSGGRRKLQVQARSRLC